MRNVKLQNLTFFVAVYEERSISAAARKVGATQSGVSVQVRDLEIQLGLTLFERISTGVAPTKAGDRIYLRAVGILREVGRLTEDAAASANKLAGKIRMGVMPTFARAVLAPVVTAFTSANPSVDLKIAEGYSPLLIQMVLAGDLDMAVVPNGVLPKGLRSTFIDTDLELLASRWALEGVNGSVDLAKIAPQRFVLPGPTNARRAKIDQQFRNSADIFHEILEMDSMMTTLDLIEGGDWCSILPGCLCLPELGNPDMHLYPIERPAMTVDYLLIESSTKAIPHAMRVFAQALSEEIQRACISVRSHFCVNV